MPQKGNQRKLGKSLKPHLDKQKKKLRGNLKQTFVEEKVYPGKCLREASFWDHIRRRRICAYVLSVIRIYQWVLYIGHKFLLEYS